MPAQWGKKEEEKRRKELLRLYVRENKTIREAAHILRIGESTVYDRLVRLGISSQRFKKARYNNVRRDIVIPRRYSSELAELIGVLLGDGHLSATQVTVTLGKKDEYAEYVAALVQGVFGLAPRVIRLKRGDTVVYLGSTVVVRWLQSMGLVFNKVRAQVDVPSWIFTRRIYIKNALRGLFDTDGSVYRLKFGTQLSFCNTSRPLLRSFRRMCVTLGFHPSRTSGKNVYLTRKSDLRKFFDEIGFRNKKHEKRFLEFTSLN